MPFSFNVGATSSQSSAKGTEKVDQGTVRLSDGSLSLTQRMAALFGQELEGPQEFTRKRALQDITGMVDSIFRQYREETLPEIMGQQKRAGAFSSSTAQTMADRAYGRASAEAGALQFGAVSQYAQLADAQKQTSLSGLIGSLEAEAMGTENVFRRTDATTSSREKGASGGFGLFS